MLHAHGTCFMLVFEHTPDRMRPRIDTLPVKGHLWSMYVPARHMNNSVSALGIHLAWSSWTHGDDGMRHNNIITPLRVCCPTAPACRNLPAPQP